MIKQSGLAFFHFSSSSLRNTVVGIWISTPLAPSRPLSSAESDQLPPLRDGKRKGIRSQSLPQPDIGSVRGEEA